MQYSQQAGSASDSQYDMLREDQLEQWLKFIRDRRWSRKQKWCLLRAFGSPNVIYTVRERLIRECVGRFQTTTAGLEQSHIRKEQDWLEDPLNSLITALDSRFPTALREITDPPIALFTRGNCDLLQEPKVAIVGSRRPTPVGAKIAEALAGDLARLGLVVTSGMALGIDGLAHQAALNRQGATIAAMGCGLDQIYPQRHRELFDHIGERGLLISEFPLGVPPKSAHFPMRNRIVSGLSLGVVIVEAAERSGTLITARMALEQDRELMVVPGSSLSKQYQGSHRLLQQGAALVTSADDIVFCIASQLRQELVVTLPCADPNSSSDNNSELDGDYQQVLDQIGSESTTMDKIISECGLTSAEVSAMLLTLELEGKIAIASDGGYVNLT